MTQLDTILDLYSQNMSLFEISLILDISINEIKQIMFDAFEGIQISEINV